MEGITTARSFHSPLTPTFYALFWLCVFFGLSPQPLWDGSFSKSENGAPRPFSIFRWSAHFHRNGGLADLWYIDDGDILSHPILVPPDLQVFDTANAKNGAEWNPQKTEDIHHASDLDAARPEWRIDDVRSLASVSTAAHGSVTLGVAVGSPPVCCRPTPRFRLSRSPALRPPAPWLSAGSGAFKPTPGEGRRHPRNA